MSTVIINIGRGKLTEGVWNLFKSDVVAAVTYYPEHEVFTIAEGTGYWEGQTEESFVVVSYQHPHNVRAVRADMVELAQRFNQDAIAMTVGDVDLIAQDGGSL